MTHYNIFISRYKRAVMIGYLPNDIRIIIYREIHRDRTRRLIEELFTLLLWDEHILGYRMNNRNAYAFQIRKYNSVNGWMYSWVYNQPYPTVIYNWISNGIPIINAFSSGRRIQYIPRNY